VKLVSLYFRATCAENHGEVSHSLRHHKAGNFSLALSTLGFLSFLSLANYLFLLFSLSFLIFFFFCILINSFLHFLTDTLPRLSLLFQSIKHHLVSKHSREMASVPAELIPSRRRQLQGKCSVLFLLGKSKSLLFRLSEDYRLSSLL
jgi:hypothetical protein